MKEKQPENFSTFTIESSPLPKPDRPGQDVFLYHQNISDLSKSIDSAGNSIGFGLFVLAIALFLHGCMS